MWKNNSVPYIYQKRDIYYFLRRLILDNLLKGAQFGPAYMTQSQGCLTDHRPRWRSYLRFHSDL